VNAAERNHDDLIVLGTHARGGLPRAFLGSTTEGVLRSGTTPVLAVQAGMHAPPADDLFRKIVVAVDDSDPGDAAVTLASRFARTLGTACVLCSVCDTGTTYNLAATYGYDPEPFIDELRAHARAVVDGALARGAFPAATASTTVPEGEPVGQILATAERSGAAAIVIGSHGRRGLRRLVLGSVAEAVIRRSTVPVFVVRQAHENAH
jgi:nucleotide-binding universal stress UspA family protein